MSLVNDVKSFFVVPFSKMCEVSQTLVSFKMILFKVIYVKGKSHFVQHDFKTLPVLDKSCENMEPMYLF